MFSGLWTWGGNHHGQLGDGTRVDRDSPVPVAALNDATAICTEYDWGCALKADGTVWTWGHNMFAQLGDGTTDDRPKPARISGISDVIAIATDSSTGYAVKADGTVWTWGSNAVVPHVGVGPDIYNFKPRKIEGLSRVAALSVRSDVLFAMRSDGTVWAWGNERTWGPGDNGYWQFGIGELVGILRSPVPVPGLTDVVELLQEEYTAYALRTDGSVWVWGQHGFGTWNTWALGETETQSGHRPWNGASAETSPAPSQSVPTRVEGLTEVKALATMWVYDREEQHHEGVSVFALRADGTVSAWGRNDYGQLGDGTLEDRWNPVDVVGLDQAIALVAVYQSVYALKKDGTVWAWGENRRGRLGDGTSIDRNTPVQVQGLTNVRSIHPYRGKNGGLLAIKGDGTLWTCGSLADIGLASAEPTPSDRASRVDAVANVTRVLADGPAYLLANGTPPVRVAQQSNPREGCFIATAIYGDYDAPAVMTLRRFRDESLASSAAGRAFTRFYYRISPRLAGRFERDSILSRLGKRLLDIVVVKLEAARAPNPGDRG